MGLTICAFSKFFYEGKIFGKTVTFLHRYLNNFLGDLIKFKLKCSWPCAHPCEVLVLVFLTRHEQTFAWDLAFWKHVAFLFDWCDWLLEVIIVTPALQRKAILCFGDKNFFAMLSHIGWVCLVGWGHLTSFQQQIWVAAWSLRWWATHVPVAVLLSSDFFIYSPWSLACGRSHSILKGSIRGPHILVLRTEDGLRHRLSFWRGIWIDETSFLLCCAHQQSRLVLRVITLRCLIMCCLGRALLFVGGRLVAVRWRFIEALVCAWRSYLNTRGFFHVW